MKLENGYTVIPNEVIQKYAYLPNKAFRTLVVLYYGLNFANYRNDNEVGECITTLTNIKRTLGYANNNLSIDELKQILRQLETDGAIKDLDISAKGTVTATLVKLFNQNRGVAYIYNKRILKGDGSLSDGELKTFLYLLSYGGFGIIKRWHHEIAKDLDVSEKTVQTNTKKLHERGLIVKHTKQALTVNGDRKYNTYEIIERVN